jgi:hypothetical protein
MTSSYVRGIPPALRQLINRTASQCGRDAEDRARAAMFNAATAALDKGASHQEVAALVTDYLKGQP